LDFRWPGKANSTLSKVAEVERVLAKLKKCGFVLTCPVSIGFLILSFAGFAQNQN
jgi:hypothetical protein